MAAAEINSLREKESNLRQENLLLQVIFISNETTIVCLIGTVYVNYIRIFFLYQWSVSVSSVVLDFAFYLNLF